MTDAEDWGDEYMDWLDELIERQLKALGIGTALENLLSDDNLKVIRNLVIDMAIYNGEDIESRRFDEAQNNIESFGDEFFRGIIVGVAMMLDSAANDFNISVTATGIYSDAAAILYERTGVQH